MAMPRFSDLQDATDLARAAGVSRADIERYAAAADQAAFYDLLRLAKRGRRRAGQFRVVHKAREEWLRDLHRAVAMMVVAATPPGAHVQGFVHGRSIRTNAAQHLGRRLVLHGDIRDFFDAITVAQVRDGLAALGANADIASLVARCCTIDGRLRQGTRCSPAVANLVCRQLDVDLLLLAGTTASTYTRYADDLVFSGDAVPDASAVAGIVERHGFALRDGRCYVQIRGCGQFVTGLHVFDDQRPRLPRRLKQRLRLVLHHIDRVGTDAHFAHRPERAPLLNSAVALEGMLRYVQSIEPQLIPKWRAQYRRGAAKALAGRAAREAAFDEAMHGPETDADAASPDAPGVTATHTPGAT